MLLRHLISGSAFRSVTTLEPRHVSPRESASCTGRTTPTSCAYAYRLAGSDPPSDDDRCPHPNGRADRDEGKVLGTVGVLSIPFSYGTLQRSTRRSRRSEVGCRLRPEASHCYRPGQSNRLRHVPPFSASLEGELIFQRPDTTLIISRLTARRAARSPRAPHPVRLSRRHSR